MVQRIQGDECVSITIPFISFHWPPCEGTLTHLSFCRLCWLSANISLYLNIKLWSIYRYGMAVILYLEVFIKKEQVSNRKSNPRPSATHKNKQTNKRWECFLFHFCFLFSTVIITDTSPLIVTLIVSFPLALKYLSNQWYPFKWMPWYCWIVPGLYK